MAHINYYRNINHIGRMTIQEAIQPGYSNISFGAFEGTKRQRNMIGLHQISRCIGNRAVILIHNDPDFEASLSRIFDFNPLLRRSGSFNMYLANQHGALNSYYDPLYGLSAGNVLDAAAPSDEGGRNVPEIQSLRSVLADYLEIMQFQFLRNKAAFGEYPFNLDLLYELTRMPYSELNRRVLAYLPDDRFADTARRLSAAEAQQRAFNAVRSFALNMKKCLWTEKGFSNHSKLSIVSTVESRNLISIYVPGSRKEILDYLAVELKAVNDMNRPYLLITSGIAVSESEEFRKLFLNEHTALAYSTGILAENLSGIIPGGENAAADSAETASLFRQIQDLFVFSCSSAVSARPFSDSIGSYYRQTAEQHIETHREPFHVFSSHSSGVAQHEVQQAIINPEELTGLGDGCLIYGSNHPVPILVDHFML